MATSKEYAYYMKGNKVAIVQKDYTLELQRVSTDAQKYQALVAAEVQTYQQEMAEKSAEYQWQAARLQDLKQEYNQAFAIMAPPQQQAQPQRRARA